MEGAPPVALGAFSSSNGSLEAAAASAAANQPAINGLQLTGLHFLIVALLIGIILISIVGNCLVCVAIFTDRRLRKLGNAFIVSLAIADLFVSCLVMTFALCNDLMNSWIFGDWFCDVWISFDIMCCTASILNLCAISLDRFIHIKDCLLYNQWMTRRVAISAVIIIWFISALVSFVPINLGWHKPDHFKGVSAPALATQQQHNSLKLWANNNDDNTLATLRAQLQNAPPDNKLNYSQGGPTIENQSSPKRQRTNKREQEDFVSGEGEGEGAGEKSAAARSSSATPSGRRRRLVGQAKDKQRVRRLVFASAQFNQVESNPRNGFYEGPQLQLQGQSFNNNSTSTTLAKPPPTTPTCMLTLTPTYAIISSTISFYIPCIIMLGLYTKLFACARKHVRNIQAISKVPAPISFANTSNNSHNSSLAAPIQFSPRNSLPERVEKKQGPLRTWLKFSACKNNNKNAQNVVEEKARQEETTATTCLINNRPQQGGGGGGNVVVTDEQAFGGKKNDSLEAPINVEKSSSKRRTQNDDEESPFLINACAKIIKQQSSITTTPITLLANQKSINKAKQSNLTSNQPQNQLSTTNENQFVQTQQQQQSRQLATHKAAITLGIIMGTFLLCWVPFFCLNIIKAMCDDCIDEWMFKTFTWLGYANSALNPIIYGIHNSEFRHAFNRIFFKHLNFKNSRYYINRRYSYDLRNQSLSSRRNKRITQKSFSYHEADNNNNNNHGQQQQFNNNQTIDSTLGV